MSDRSSRPHDELIHALLGPEGPEISCEECFEQLDRYVELELAAHEADAAIPGMAAHLTGCPACREDHDSLLALVRRGPPARGPGSPEARGG